MAKTNATLKCEIFSALDNLDNKQLTEVLDIVNGYANLKGTDKAPEKAPKKASKPKKVEYVKLHCIKGIPSNVWAKVNHTFTEEFNAKWVKGKKKGTGFWEFSDTLKDDGEIDVPASEWCTKALESQVKYAKSKGIECAIGTLA